jgi:hypothetical protein
LSACPTTPSLSIDDVNLVMYEAAKKEVTAW